MPDETGPDVPVIGVSKLTDVYGYWISFHDASVESVLIERHGPPVTVAFGTCDMAYRDGKLVDSDLAARVVVRWRQVQECSLEGIDPDGRNWIDGLSLAPSGPSGEWVRSELELMDGLHGKIVARQVEVVDVEPRGTCIRLKYKPLISVSGNSSTVTSASAGAKPPRLTTPDPLPTHQPPAFPDRTFTIRDSMILVAAVAAGVLGYRVNDATMKEFGKSNPILAITLRMVSDRVVDVHIWVVLGGPGLTAVTAGLVSRLLPLRRTAWRLSGNRDSWQAAYR